MTNLNEKLEDTNAAIKALNVAIEMMHDAGAGVGTIATAEAARTALIAERNALVDAEAGAARDAMIDELEAATATSPREVTDADLDAFVEKVQAIVNGNDDAHGYTDTCTVEWMKGGRKYIRVIRRRPSGGRSVHCFVERATGDVLKAASWKGPADHARGSIFADDAEGMGVGPYGAKYLK